MKTPMDDLDQATRALVGTSKRDSEAPEASDSRTTMELVALYLRDPESDEGGRALGIVQYRGGKHEFEIAERLAKSNLALERRVAADILAQLGWQDETYLSESIELLLRLLDDPETEVLQAAAIACGHRKSPLSVARLVELATHPNAAVRYGVSYGLAGQDVPPAISALLLLSKDEDRDVRDWATFALASQTELDTPDLREALRARLADSDPEIRGEALVGLSKRQDGYLKSAILDELNGEFHGDWVFEAAGAMPDTAFIPALESMRARMGAELPKRYFVHLDEALLACKRREHSTQTGNGV